jgi:hypothetical protein
MFSAGSNSAIWLIEAKDGSWRAGWQPDFRGLKSEPADLPARRRERSARLYDGIT